jgi:hypothetical protein
MARFMAVSSQESLDLRDSGGKAPQAFMVGPCEVVQERKTR